MRYCSNIPNINSIEYKKSKIQDILNTTKNTNQIYKCMLGSLSESASATFYCGIVSGIFLPDPFSIYIGTIGFVISNYVMILQQEKMLARPEEINSIINSDYRLYEYIFYNISCGIITSNIFITFIRFIRIMNYQLG